VGQRVQCAGAPREELELALLLGGRRIRLIRRLSGGGGTGNRDVAVHRLDELLGYEAVEPQLIARKEEEERGYEPDITRVQIDVQ